MKRCVDSGLWVPSKEDPSTNTEDGFVKRDGVEGRSRWIVIGGPLLEGFGWMDHDTLNFGLFMSSEGFKGPWA